MSKGLQIFLGSWLIPGLLWAADPLRSHLPASRQAFFNQLNSLTMEIVDESSNYFDEPLGDYPWLAKIVQLEFLKWDATGKPQRHIEFCDAKVWSREVLRPDQPANAWRTQFQKFLTDCNLQWETMWSDAVSNTVGMMNLKLNPNRHPFARHVIFHLPNNVKLKGLLAMKTDGKRRPLVVLRTGLFSNTQEFYPERTFLMSLFDQSPFHVLVLESSSSSEFLRHNRSYALGGFDEGLQNFLLAQRFQDPREPVSRFIHSVHMAGVSLGGHGAIFANLLNQLNPGPEGRPWIRSTLGICPLINMRETLDYHMTQGLSMDAMNYWASRRLKILKERIPELQNSAFIPQLLNWFRQNYNGPTIAEGGQLGGIRLPSDFEALLANPKQRDQWFWTLNQFIPYYQNVQSPLLILTTLKDPIVSWHMNTGRLSDGRLKLENSNVEAFTFDQGYHCSFSVAYDWSSLASVMQTFVLRASPGFEQQTKEMRVPIPDHVLKQIRDQIIYVDTTFEVSEQSAALFVKVRFDREFWPGMKDRFLAPRMVAQLPLSEMEFPLDDVVRTSAEASLLRRWAYQNVEAKIIGNDIVFRWNVTR
jgi:hypothetical protein